MKPVMTDDESHGTNGRFSEKERGTSLLERIAATAEKAVRCTVTHLRSTPIVETFQSELVWEGTVEEFSVMLPPPLFIYAWVVNAEREPRYIAVYSSEIIKTPLDAVRAWIVSQRHK